VLVFKALDLFVTAILVMDLLISNATFVSFC